MAPRGVAERNPSILVLGGGSPVAICAPTLGCLLPRSSSLSSTTEVPTRRYVLQAGAVNDVEHHVGIDRLVPIGLAADRIREAVAARTDPNLVIVGRSNALRVEGMDDALRRAEAMKNAGADMLFLWGRKPEEMRFIAERLPAPLMTFAPPDGFSTFPISKAEMAKMGYRLAASSGTAFAAMVKAVRQSYDCLAQDTMDPFLGPGGAEKEMKTAHQVTGLDRLLEIERRTMKGA